MKYLEATVVLNFHALAQSFCIVGVAEIFDKTWFVALVMAMMYNKLVVFCSASLALVLHTFIAAGLGWGISRFFHISTLHFCAATLYAVFAVLYGLEWYHADAESDVIAAGKEEAAEAVNVPDTEYGSLQNSKASKSKQPRRTLMQVFVQCFLAVFIAEWGDRTQIAMIGQSASQAIVPVCLGSSLAFLALTASAVLVGMVLGEHTLSEKKICIVSTLSFAVFSVLATWDGMAARAAETALVL